MGGGGLIHPTTFFFLSTYMYPPTPGGRENADFRHRVASQGVVCVHQTLIHVKNAGDRKQKKERNKTKKRKRKGKKKSDRAPLSCRNADFLLVPVCVTQCLVLAIGPTWSRLWTDIDFDLAIQSSRLM